MQTLIENENGLESRNEELRKELSAIAARRGGLTPKTVLDVAKNPNSTLHKYFTWDNTEAARRYREVQAGELIRRVKVTILANDSKPVTVRAFWPVKQIESDGTINRSKPGSYIPISDVLENQEATRQLIANAKAELKAFSCKYRTLEKTVELQGVFREIDKTTK